MGLEGGTEGVVSGAELNEETYRQALETAPQLFAETFCARGKQLEFAPDRWGTPLCCCSLLPRHEGLDCCRCFPAPCLNSTPGSNHDALRADHQPTSMRSPLLTHVLGVACRRRDVSKEIRTPVDWIQMPLSFEPGGSPCNCSESLARHVRRCVHACMQHFQGLAHRPWWLHVRSMSIAHVVMLQQPRTPADLSAAKSRSTLPLPPFPSPAGEDGRSMVLTCPAVDTPTAPLPAFDRGPGRMAGNHYVKACSPAWMHEWIMIEGLRR